jgi:uncharacterized protein (DUF983 family)
VDKLVAYCACPHCGAGLGFFRYWFRSKPSAEWVCTGCGARLRLDAARHERLQLMALAILVAGVFLATFGLPWWCVLLIAVRLALAFFEKAESVQVDGQGQQVGPSQIRP